MTPDLRDFGMPLGVVLASQLESRHAHARGELRLLASVLLSAIEDLGKSAATARYAARWIHGGTVGAVPFDELCDALGVDPGRIRRATPMPGSIVPGVGKPPGGFDPTTTPGVSVRIHRR